ncbi:esterase-like activity of phytase family protein [Dyadobacter sp. CY356]|uniref:esterase-like activity of phytase family protein n=1 Tax=Dyadobacter sp. CY356 TaxID=2906442 RepID=UPI001F380C1C|nr:esterase-like activity of phytase family protein [Dyadobacter sp. CY356]MCF0056403.1 esterase-like activity of phytase family protein [Dyadobacter sp. CY356]
MKKLFLVVFSCLCFQNLKAQSLTFGLSDYTILAKKPAGILHGISGIEYITAKKQWHLASDRGNYFIFDSISNIRDFENRQNLAISKKTGYWFEAIRFDPKYSTFLYAVENEYKPNNETNDTTTYVSYYDSFPPAYLIPPMHLPADNKGIEAIAVTDSGAVWIAPEAGWQGETEFGNDTIHFWKFDRKNSGYSEAIPYTYVIDRSGCPLSTTEKRGGISEILAVKENQLLVLERCYDEKVSKKIKAKLWQVTVDGATLKKDPAPAFDFNDNFPFVVDNLEGMAWWPGDNEKRQILLVTDDNPGLKNSQRTQLILLKEK